jgi:hypothetical protein
MQLVVLIGRRKAVGIAVHGIKGCRRWSKLRELPTTDGAAVAVLPSAHPRARPLAGGIHSFPVKIVSRTPHS